MCRDSWKVTLVESKNEKYGVQNEHNNSSLTFHEYTKRISHKNALPSLQNKKQKSGSFQVPGLNL